ncbi:MAG: pyridoxamine 5'-phosphate oxidase [Robiginitomaculum sp.]|nr:MAG: pyridoxamine 5'-phosphate oxidase [Robiginitomaculum sp.]
MAKTYESLDDKLVAFIKAQKLFFVATAPLGPGGHVNVSPKGYDSFAVIDPLTVAYLDLGGSGIETLAHLKENGRITIMFCAFEGKANILRIYGRGEAVSFDDPGFDDLCKLFPPEPRVRSVIKINITRIMDSCGWGVPFYEFSGERDQLRRAHLNRGSEDFKAHRYDRNEKSIDGLEGLIKPNKTKPVQ